MNLSQFTANMKLNNLKTNRLFFIGQQIYFLKFKFFTWKFLNRWRSLLDGSRRFPCRLQPTPEHERSKAWSQRPARNEPTQSRWPGWKNIWRAWATAEECWWERIRTGTRRSARAATGGMKSGWSTGPIPVRTRPANIRKGKRWTASWARTEPANGKRSSDGIGGNVPRLTLSKSRLVSSLRFTLHFRTAQMATGMTQTYMMMQVEAYDTRWKL